MLGVDYAYRFGLGNRPGLHYSHFWHFLAQAPIENQLLILQKYLDPGSNPRSRVKRIQQLVGNGLTTAELEDDLLYATVRNAVDAVTILLRNEHRITPGNARLLPAAIANRNLAIARLLLSAGANPDIPDRGPIIDAVGRGDKKLIESLLQYGAAFSLEDVRLFAMAAERGFADALQTLLNHVKSQAPTGEEVDRFAESLGKLDKVAAAQLTAALLKRDK